MSQDQYMKLADGRTLSYTTYNTPITAGQAVAFYFHGSPGTHAEGAPVAEAASRHGIALIGVTRPGYGGSTLQPERDILSFPADVLSLADHLGVQRFAAFGISGGAPYLLACLHALPSSRFLGGVVVSGMYPASLGMSGMSLQNRILFNLAPWAPGLLAWLLGRSVAKVAQDTEHPERFEKLMADNFAGWPEVDRAAMAANDDRFLKVLVRSSAEALKHGAEGFACEAKLFGAPWGFNLEDIQVDRGRLVLWHGAKDVNIPVGMADKASKLIPNAEYRRFEDEAHISLCANHMDEILDSLAKILTSSVD
ncbi:Alpha/Beta hydrolase protein [Nemania sp. FL0916]|nr:Alpha/Beta hydrolase protein [Nemania sp. FL0916]